MSTLTHPAWCNLSYHYPKRSDHSADVGGDIRGEQNSFVQIGVEAHQNGGRDVVVYVSECDGRDCRHGHWTVNPDCAGGDGVRVDVPIDRARDFIDEIRTAVGLLSVTATNGAHPTWCDRDQHLPKPGDDEDCARTTGSYSWGDYCALEVGPIRMRAGGDYVMVFACTDDNDGHMAYLPASTATVLAERLWLALQWLDGVGSVDVSMTKVAA